MRILIVDDDPLVCRSLQVLLGREPDIAIIATAADGAAAVEVCRSEQPDAVLMDIRMPGMDGIRAASRIKRDWPHIKIMMLTTFRDRPSIDEALQAGADGYMLKSAQTPHLARQLRAMLAGASVLDRQVLEQLLPRRAPPPPPDMLTPRELEIMRLIAEGCSNREIAAALYIGEGTVRNALTVILDKLELRDRTQLAIRYWRERS
ncbi:response regulator transcription factor [Paenibacillus sp. IB182496]|uniref:Response regulator transcription factor n=2 Tax=Paenibacillus sabuli TaxID=2772509 RepID=A0A927GSJ2_9BACL|nr:response regulator transcription factor [Paenibacillus sabuli]